MKSDDEAMYENLYYSALVRQHSDWRFGMNGSRAVANKIIKVMEELGLTRFYLHLPIASMPHEDVMNAIRIYGEEVVPNVKTYFQKKTEQDRLKLKWKN